MGMTVSYGLRFGVGLLGYWVQESTWQSTVLPLADPFYTINRSIEPFSNGPMWATPQGQYWGQGTIKIEPGEEIVFVPVSVYVATELSWEETLLRVAQSTDQFSVVSVDSTHYLVVSDITNTTLSVTIADRSIFYPISGTKTKAELIPLLVASLVSLGFKCDAYADGVIIKDVGAFTVSTLPIKKLPTMKILN